MTIVGESVTRIPTLESDRLRLRAPLPDDFEPYAAFCASDQSRLVGGPYNRDQAWNRFIAVAGQWALRGFGRWIVAERESDAPLGVVGLFYPNDWPEPEIAWTVFAEAEGRGIAHEAALMSRRYAYEVAGWATAVSCIAPDNPRSQALARRLDAVEDGLFEHPEYGPLAIWRHPGPEAAT
ncbi:MAG: GNAT family N-acetyltransferase [Pseudomonadota bacterium]